MNYDIFQTDLCVLIAYTPGSSGKFLKNCLSFHSKFQPLTARVFDDIKDQRQYLQQQMLYQSQLAHEEWQDFNTTERHFYSTPGLWSDQPVSEQDIERYRQKILARSENVTKCLEQGRYFFKELHRVAELNAYRRIWPNAREILLVNARPYIDLRYQGTLLAEDPQYIRSTDIETADITIQWDCANFLDWTKFLPAYQQLLSEFDVEAENTDGLERFYRAYYQHWFLAKSGH